MRADEEKRHRDAALQTKACSHSLESVAAGRLRNGWCSFNCRGLLYAIALRGGVGQSHMICCRCKSLFKQHVRDTLLLKFAPEWRPRGCQQVSHVSLVAEVTATTAKPVPSSCLRGQERDNHQGTKTPRKALLSDLFGKLQQLPRIAIYDCLGCEDCW